MTLRLEQGQVWSDSTRRPSSTSSCRASGETSPSHSVMLPSN
ncbi:hypothetical protein GBAR_LOCUS10547 [Geodia barretti]|uniref:Uncharacterized protein n=1 Tax=Geodia barretti TaxID=519541 RepID=A0AA35RU84_GEOBA|nr:hypothetical protein GBAR_LOCUS10547 [Geodia barretti]